MKYFPIFVRLKHETVVLVGGGDAAVAKLRLLLKSEASIRVFAAAADPVIEAWEQAGLLELLRRRVEPWDLAGVRLVYAATEDEAEDARTVALSERAGVLYNVVDNLSDSAFITPAIVDRDPVTVAIGTEGTAPVLARAIKADVEAALPTDLGARAKAAAATRPAAEALAPGRPRRTFWRDFFFGRKRDTKALLQEHLNRIPKEGHVAFVGAGPGDPEHLTLKARRLLDEADVVIHDRLVPLPILELARREATIIEAGKTGFGKAMAQGDINDLIVEHGRAGAQVVRLKSGDPTVFGRLDEEIEACEAAGIGWEIAPGITAASAAVAAAGQSLTRRGRNSDIRLMTGHDTKGFAEHDWQALARPGVVAAIYMGKRSARFVQGRLLMHGANPDTPITVVENAGRPGERILSTHLAQLEPDLTNANVHGPALILFGLAPRRAVEALPQLLQEAVQ